MKDALAEKGLAASNAYPVAVIGFSWKTWGRSF
jgi:hypothetical protein